MPTFHTHPVEREDDRTVAAVRRCDLCKQDIMVYVRPEDWTAFLEGRGYIQNLFPYLTAAERELLLNGFCGPCFDSFCPPDED